MTGARRTLSVAGRTDAGVHAWGQVASFALGRASRDVGVLARSLNGVLPHGRGRDRPRRRRRPASTPAGTRGRGRYCYRVLARAAPSPFERGRALWWPHPVDEEALERLRAAARRARTTSPPSRPPRPSTCGSSATIREAAWARDGDVLEFWIEADTFMRHMVRVLVGHDARGRRAAAGRREDFARLLEGAPRSRGGGDGSRRTACIWRRSGTEPVLAARVERGAGGLRWCIPASAGSDRRAQSRTPVMSSTRLVVGDAGAVLHLTLLGRDRPDRCGCCSPGRRSSGRVDRHDRGPGSSRSRNRRWSCCSGCRPRRAGARGIGVQVDDRGVLLERHRAGPSSVPQFSGESM